MNITDFFNSDFKAYSNQDNIRSIPSLIDGLKEAQRKAMYGMMCHGSSEIKVSQAAGKFALVSEYKHGETSMEDTIVKMAQDYPGSNNVNMFEPIGQFGSILTSQSAASRYIFTKQSKYLREYFKSSDDCILEYQYEDGIKIEPEYYYPILPLWIVNGALGVGTGHAVKIFPRNPDKIKRLVSNIIEGKSSRNIEDTLTPYYVGWNGDVVYPDPDDKSKIEFHGKLEKINTTTIRIIELPPNHGIDKIKSTLVKLMDDGRVKDYDNNSTEEHFDIEVKVSREVGRLSEDELKQLFKLVSRQTENVTLWNTDHKIVKYDSVYDALCEFIEYRLEKYESRRLKQLDILMNEKDFLTNKERFIIEWNKLDNPGKQSIDKLRTHMIKYNVKEQYLDQLFSLKITSLTLDSIEDLNSKMKRLDFDIDGLKKSTNVDLYKLDLVSQREKE